ncbi:T-cell receptor alpha chain V region CTL-L17 [Sciurus carolinensis]|nr:T-cell receptor alpha chain V region CTL-L17 [Sciurus carolinensis]
MQRRLGALLGLLWVQVCWTKQEGRLKATVDSKERYSTLHISTSQLEDSGTYLCAAEAQCSQGTCSLSPNCRCTCSHSLCLREDLASSVCTAVGVLIHILALSPLLTGDFSVPSSHLGVSQGENVEQSPSTLSVQEEDSAVINCTYSNSASSYFPWYKQEAGKAPQMIIDIRSSKEMNQIQRLIVVLNKRAKHFFLNITATQAGDSAVYFCAASAQCFPDTCSLYSNLPLD